MLECLYNSSDKFKTFLNEYDALLIVQDIHRDTSQLKNSEHFNMRCYNNTTGMKSGTRHMYINSDGEISRMTALITTDF
jgi:hypothetical protein